MDLGFSKPTFSQKGSKRTKQTTRHSSFPLISLMPGSVVGISHTHTHTYKYTVASDPSRTHARPIFPTALPFPLRPLGSSRVNNPAFLPFRRRAPSRRHSSLLSLSFSLLLVLSSDSRRRGRAVLFAVRGFRVYKRPRRAKRAGVRGNGICFLRAAPRTWECSTICWPTGGVWWR